MPSSRAKCSHCIYLKGFCGGNSPWQEAQAQAAVTSGKAGALIAGAQVSHIAHLMGALSGVLLVLLLTRLPAVPDGDC
jgi:membrane associated rhomboid family serine protease